MHVRVHVLVLVLALQRIRGLGLRRDLGPASHENADDARKRLGQLMTVHDHVDHAMREQVFRALEALGKLLADGLLDDPRAGKADEGTWLGHLDIAEHGIGGGHAAGRRIGEDHDIGQPGFLEFGQRDGRPRHLHQRQDSFLHPGATGGGEGLRDLGDRVGHRSGGEDGEGVVAGLRGRAGQQERTDSGSEQARAKRVHADDSRPMRTVVIYHGL